MSSIDEKIIQDAKELFIQSDKWLQITAQNVSKKGLIRAIRLAFNDDMTNTEINLKDEMEIRAASILQDLLQSWTILKAVQLQQIQDMQSIKENENVEK